MSPTTIVPPASSRRTNSRGRRLDPLALLQSQARELDLERLRGLRDHSVVGHGDLPRDAVVELCHLGARMEASDVASYHPLDGKLVITAFFEPSTRTRLSFESAVARLDGKLLSVPDGKVTGVAKGESLQDIGEMFNSYGDLLVMRHTRTEAVQEIQAGLAVPLVNAGNGSGEHPTQALVDWYALLKWRPALSEPEPAADQRIHLGVVGTPGNMRAVKSFVFMALAFAPAIRRLTVVSELADPFGADLHDAIERSSIPIEVTNDITEVLPELDVVYMNSIALLGDSYKQLGSRYRITTESPLRPDAVIMHPLARRDELDVSLDDSRHNLYFAQAAGAVYVRQALLVSLLGRVHRLPFFD
ncbi:MAG: aspartate carbamoyltransferase [Nannocystaceae bacterium]